jgi:hypothetical protein
MANPSARPVTVCGHRLDDPRHVCCFFDSREQRDEVLLPYLREGLANREQVLCVMDADVVDDHHRKLAAAGVDVDAERASGHLQTGTSEDTYLAGGHFAKERMFRLLEQRLNALRTSSYTGMRTCGDMAWALREVPGRDELMMYENEVNNLLTGRDDVTFLCVYDASRISGRMMLDVLSTHTHVVIGKSLHKNQLAMTTDAFRRAYAARRAAGR